MVLEEELKLNGVDCIGFRQMINKQGELL